MSDQAMQPASGTNTADADLESLCVNAIRFLSIDAVDKANSGHPGTPMGLADIAWVLWTEFLRHDPQQPHWQDRDRFVLSAGHASMLLYSLLHLAGYEDMTLEQIQAFRQWDSLTPGHPEYGHTTGVEVTTGPLGQGFAHAVGMALGAKMLAARFNGSAFGPVSHRVYGICSDGDLMEGISAEAASLAGHLGLGNLIFFYDDNRISIEGETRLSFSEDVRRRFEAVGWQVQSIDGHDRAAIRKAIRKAQKDATRPSLIIARTVIGWGSPNMHGSHEVHGAPLGREETAATKAALGWPASPDFHVPDAVRAEFTRKVKKLARARRRWDKDMRQWRGAQPEMAAEWDRYWSHDLPSGLAADLVAAAQSDKAVATRQLSGQVIQKIAESVPFLIGGSADLAPSTNTLMKKAGSLERSEGSSKAPEDSVFAGRNLHYGIREHAMGAIVNGLTLYGPWRAFGATFLIFSDYMRPSIRLAALMGIPAIFVFTHDSVFLGEDGPTHQPVEHLFALRLIPNMTVFRPCDGTEVAMAWLHALEAEDGPTTLVLTRQKLDPIRRTSAFDPSVIRRGAYVLEGFEHGDVTFIATGSEVSLAVKAAELLRQRGIEARVVSAPCLDLFERQTPEYQRSVLGDDPDAIVSIEAGRTSGWHRWVGPKGLTIGIDRFGASAPAERIAAEFGLTPAAVADKVSAWR